jgi:Subtilase family
LTVFGTFQGRLYFSKDWHLNFLCRRINTDYPSDLPGGTFCLHAKNVDVYVLSTGVNVQHSELYSRVFPLPGYVSTLSSDTLLSGADCAEEGTFAAQLIAGRLTGVAKLASIWTAKITNSSGDFSLEDFEKAINKVLENIESRGRPSLVYISYFRIPTYEKRFVADREDLFEEYVKELTKRNIPVIVPAGDGLTKDGVPVGYLNSRVVSPARMDEVISVGALTSKTDVLENSCYGSKITCWAPGKDISVRNLEGTDSTYYSSSKAAAALVAGICAMFLERFPDKGLKEFRSFINKQFEVRQFPGYPVTQMARDPVLSPDPDLGVELQFAYSDYSLVYYLPELIRDNSFLISYAFFTHAVLKILTTTLGSVMTKTSVVLEIQAESLDMYGNRKPLIFYLKSSPFDLEIGESSGLIFGNIPDVPEGSYEIVVGVTDGILATSKSFSLNVFEGSDPGKGIGGKVTVSKKRCFLLNCGYSEDPGLLNCQVKKTVTVNMPDEREVVLMERATGRFVSRIVSDKQTGRFFFKVNPDHYQVLIKHPENQKYQIADVQVS